MTRLKITIDVEVPLGTVADDDEIEAIIEGNALEADPKHVDLADGRRLKVTMWRPRVEVLS